MSFKFLRSKTSAVVAALLVVLVAAASLYGPLFPWSPVKPGYAEAAFSRADVYYDPNQKLPDDYRNVDAMMNDAEAFHRLKFHHRVEVVACKNWLSCKWFMPWMNINPLGGVTLATGDAIYITPKIKEKGFSVAEFLRHELSHALISQNTTVRKSLKLNNVVWFNEGMAVSFGRQTSYLSRAEFMEKAATAELVDFIDPVRIAQQQASGSWPARFAYPAQRYFVEYLKDRFGHDVFQQFLLRCINDPDNYSSLFIEIFHQPLDDAVGDYQQAVRAGRWPPQN